MRKTNVYVNNTIAGNLIENDEDIYIFQYHEKYIENPISLTLQVRKEPYKSKILFPFCFQNLLLFFTQNILPPF